MVWGQPSGSFQSIETTYGFEATNRRVRPDRVGGELPCHGTRRHWARRDSLAPSRVLIGGWLRHGASRPFVGASGRHHVKKPRLRIWNMTR
eukprot:scaffold73_cov337-Pavlova_lutheri.AAC.14